MRKRTLQALAVLASGVLLAGCTGVVASTSGSAQTTSASSQIARSDSDLAPAAVLAENADYTTVNPDEWSVEDAVDITLSGTGAESESSGVTVSDGTLTITEAGVFRLSGSFEGQVVVAAPEDAQVVLILDGADITSDFGSAIDVQSADDVAIHLAEGTSNSVADGSEYDENADANAAIYSAADLTISGTGALEVTANYNDGVTSKDDLVILGGDVSVDAVDDALRGKDSLVVEGGTLDLTAGGDGLKSDGDEGDDDIDWTQGYVYVAGGEITIEAEDDGLQAFTDTIIAGGTVTAAVVDDAVKAEVIVSIGEVDGLDAPEVTVTASTEGIEAANIGISGGVVDVTASDDAINASGNSELQALIDGSEYVDDGSGEFADTGERLEISGGTVTVDAEGDGLDSNGSLTVTGGDTVVYGPSSGGNGSLDADGTISITDGTLVTFGPGSMEETPDAEGQGWVLASTQVSAGDTVTVEDESGNILAEYTAAKNANTVIFSSADIEMGSSYSVTVSGGTSVSAVAGEGGFAGGQGAPQEMGENSGQPGGPGGPGQRPEDEEFPG